MYKLVLFQTANVNFALELGCIRHMGAKTNTPKVVQGRIQVQTIKHEGLPVKLIDLAAALDDNAGASYPADGKVIILKGAQANALWADKVKGLFTTDAEHLHELPSVFTGTARSLFTKVLRFKENLFLVVDAAALAKLDRHGGASVSARTTSEGVA